VYVTVDDYPLTYDNNGIVFVAPSTTSTPSEFRIYGSMVDVTQPDPTQTPVTVSQYMLQLSNMSNNGYFGIITGSTTNETTPNDVYNYGDIVENFIIAPITDVNELMYIPSTGEVKMFAFHKDMYLSIAHAHPGSLLGLVYGGSNNFGVVKFYLPDALVTGNV